MRNKYLLEFQSKCFKSNKACSYFSARYGFEVEGAMGIQGGIKDIFESNKKCIKNRGV